MTRIYVSTFVLLGLVALASCKSDAPPPPAAPVALTEVSGPHWRMKVPKGWQEKGEHHYVGPDGANVLVVERTLPIDITLLTDATAKNLESNLDGYRIIRKNTGKVGSARAIELLGAHEIEGETVVTLTVLVDGGDLKFMITCSVVETHYGAHRETFTQMVASFEGERVTRAGADPQKDTLSTVNASIATSFREACQQQSNAEACYRYAVMLEGKLADPAEGDTAKGFFERACALNKHEEACEHLGEAAAPR